MSATAEARAGSEAWTIERVLGWATDDFRARGLESPRLDAELLLSDTLGVDRVRLIVESKRPLTAPELAGFRERIRRRRSGEPIAYILGSREFYGLPFRVDARVLIPRPDTEALVDVALERTAERYMFGNALDLCTGSGCVAIAFAKRRPTWRVTAVDVSPEALGLAEENALRLSAVFGMRFVRSDLTQGLAPADRFDLITANPPYVPTAVMAGLDAGIREFEPKLALDGGADGLAVITRLVEEAVPRLASGGVLATEVHYDQASRVAEMFERAGLVQIDKRRDYGGHERVVSGARR